MAEERKCKHCGKIFSSEKFQSPQAALMSHIRSEHKGEKADATPENDAPLGEGTPSSEGEEGELIFGPMTRMLQETLSRWLGSKDQRRVQQICEIADRSAQAVFQNPDSLKAFLSKFSLPADLLEACTLSIFGYQPGPPSPGQPPWPQQGYPPYWQAPPWPQQGYPYPGGSSREIYQYGVPFPVPSQYSPGGSEQPQPSSDAISRDELNQKLADLENRLINALKSLQPSGPGPQTDQEKEQLQKENEDLRRKLEYQSEINSLRNEIRELKENSQSNSEQNNPRISELQNELNMVRKDQQLEQRLREVEERHSQELRDLKESLMPPREPSEGEIKSRNLDTITERASNSLDRLTEAVERVSAPVLGSQIATNLRQLGFDDQAIIELIKSGQQPRPSSGSSSSGASIKDNQGSLRDKVAEFKSKYIKTE